MNRFLRLGVIPIVIGALAWSETSLADVFPPRVSSAEESLVLEFLSTDQTSSEAKTQVLTVFAAMQVVWMRFAKDQPLQTPAQRNERERICDLLRSKGYSVTGEDHHKAGKIFPKIRVVFRPFDSGASRPDDWLNDMLVVVARGYKVEEVRLVYSPSALTRRDTFHRCSQMVRLVSDELLVRKKEFKQLSEFYDMAAREGCICEEPWPQFPSLWYRYGFGEEIPNSKGDYKKTTEDWCEISVWFRPEDGHESAMGLLGRTYPRQGVSALWLVRSANEDGAFNAEVVDIIVRSLKPLDEFEEGLGRRK